MRHVSHPTRVFAEVRGIEDLRRGKFVSIDSTGLRQGPFSGENGGRAPGYFA